MASWLFDSLSNNTRKSTKEGKGKMRTNTRNFRLALTSLTLVTLLLSMFAVAPVYGQTTHYVNPDDICGGNTPCYTTIQAAINAAAAGDTIIVAAGTYPEKLVINKAGITLQGDGSYPMIQPALATSNKYDTVIAIQAADVTIRGLDVSNALGAVDTGWMPGGTHIEHHAIWDGAWTLGPANLHVDDCIFHDIEHGVRSYGPGLIVENSEFFNLRRSGVHASGPYQNQPLPFTITNNYFHDFHYCQHAVAVHIKYDSRVGEVSYNYIAGVRLGVWPSLGQGPKTGFGQIVIKHNTFDRNAIDPDAYDHGIYGGVELKNAFSFCGTEAKDGILIQDNIVANTREPGSDWGFAIWGGGCACAHTGVISVDNNLFYNINEGADNVTNPPSGCCGPFKLFFGGQYPNAQACWGGPEGAFAFTNHIDMQDPGFCYTGTTPQEWWGVLAGGPADSTATDGTNVGASPLYCVPPCTDNDGDGYAIEGGDCGPIDCDDSNADIYPGVVVETDVYGYDNIGECKTQQDQCDGSTGQMVRIRDAVGPSPEVCDGKDDDCNGSVDDVDDDNDGVNDCTTDECLDSVEDNIDLNPNQYAQNIDFGAFECGPNNDQSIVYDMDLTRGCTCKEIVEKLGKGKGHLKKGCSPSVMEEWTGVSAEPDRKAGVGKK